MFERIKLATSLFAMAMFPSLFGKIDPALKVDSGTASRGAPRWMGASHDVYAKEGFSKNAVAKRCIEMIAQAVASIPIELFNKRTNEEVEDVNHPFLKLVNSPNPYQSKEVFLEELISHFYIDGNTFFNCVKLGAVPAEIYVKNPKFMKLAIGDDGLPRRWEYSNGQDTAEFPIDYVKKTSDIFHFKTFNPMDHWVGMSPLKAVADSIDQNNEAGEWNMWMLQNAGMPSGGFESPTNLSKDQYERVKKQIKDNITGAKNARSPVISDGGLKWVSYGQTAVDMDWLEGTRASARQIAFGLGTPSQLIGIPGDNTYSNLEQADLAFYEKTVCILFNKLIKAFNTYFAPFFGPDLELRGDFDSISALEPRRREKWEKVKTCDFLTINEKRESVGYDRLDIPEADMVWIQAGLVPLEMSTELLEGEEANEDGEESDNDESEDEDGEDSGVDDAEPDAPKPGDKPKPKTPKGTGAGGARGSKKFIRYRTRHKNARVSA